jgi:hypothetical protein
MFPHERSLVQRYEQRPFALLGVNVDSSLAVLRKSEEKDRLNWRSWWDKDGSISDKWNLEGLPTVILIDHRGVIRFESKGAPNAKDLDRRIERLVLEAESASS